MDKKIYVADCIEHGDRFISLFKTAERNPDKRYEMGKNMASEWGGECIEIRLALGDDIGDENIDNIWDFDISHDDNMANYTLPDGPIPKG